jgi:hypothetical protein
VASPHDIAFRYRPHILALVLAGAVGAVVIDPGSDRADKLSDALSIALVSALGYGTMRTFVWLVVRPLTDRLPRLVRGWGLVWFYGAIPLSLLGLYLGSSTLHAPTPSAGTVAFVVAASASMAAGTFAAIRATAGRLTPGWSGP